MPTQVQIHPPSSLAAAGRLTGVGNKSCAFGAVLRAVRSPEEALSQPSIPRPDSRIVPESGREVTVEFDAPLAPENVSQVIANTLGRLQNTDLDVQLPASSQTTNEALAEKDELPTLSNPSFSRAPEPELEDSDDARDLNPADGGIDFLFPAMGTRVLRLGILQSSYPPSQTEASKPVSLSGVTPDVREAVPKTDELVFRLTLKAPQPLSPNAGPTAPGDPATVCVKEDEASQAELPVSPAQVSCEPRELEVVSPRKSNAELRDLEHTLQVARSLEGPKVSSDPVPVTWTNRVEAPSSAVSAGEPAAPRLAPRATSEPPAMLFQPRPTAPLQRIQVVVRGESQAVRVEIQQSRGEVKVAVHADDAALAVRLRESLPELLRQLDTTGTEVRSFVNAMPATERSPVVQTADLQQHFDRRGSQDSPPQQRRDRHARRPWHESFQLEEE